MKAIKNRDEYWIEYLTNKASDFATIKLIELGGGELRIHIFAGKLKWPFWISANGGSTYVVLSKSALSNDKMPNFKV
jgi:hypothetical protein